MLPVPSKCANSCVVVQVIAEALLSLSPEEADETFAKMYLPIVTEGNTRTWYPYRTYVPSPDFFAFHRHVKVLNDYITSLISRRQDTRFGRPRTQGASSSGCSDWTGGSCGQSRGKPARLLGVRTSWTRF
jgi:cytochrome P450